MDEELNTNEPERRRPQPFRRVWDPRYRTSTGGRSIGFLPYYALAVAVIALLDRAYFVAAVFGVPFLWWFIWWFCFGMRNRDD